MQPPRNHRALCTVVLSAAEQSLQAASPDPAGGVTELPPGTQEEGPGGRVVQAEGTGACEPGLPSVSSAVLPLSPEHFKVTTWPEVHPSLKWKKSVFNETSQASKSQVPLKRLSTHTPEAWEPNTFYLNLELKINK